MQRSVGLLLTLSLSLSLSLSMYVRMLITMDQLLRLHFFGPVLLREDDEDRWFAAW